MKIQHLLLVALIAFATAAVRADEASDKDQIRDLEKSFGAALVKGDFQALRDAFPADMVIVYGPGEIHKWDEFVQQLKAGEFKFLAYDIADLDVRVVGDTAVVIGHAHAQAKVRDDVIDIHDVFTDTFARTNGKWRCILGHSSDVPTGNP